jgi:hypothetical protein
VAGTKVRGRRIRSATFVLDLEKHGLELLGRSQWTAITLSQQHRAAPPDGDRQIYWGRRSIENFFHEFRGFRVFTERWHATAATSSSPGISPGSFGWIVNRPYGPRARR